MIEYISKEQCKAIFRAKCSGVHFVMIKKIHNGVKGEIKLKKTIVISHERKAYYKGMNASK